MTIERRAGLSAWTYESHRGDKVESFPVRVSWRGPFVDVRIVTPEGEAVERHGQMKVERVLAEGPNERLIERIRKVRVTSLFGDVVGEDRTMRGAAEDYASKVLRIVVDERGRKAKATGKHYPASLGESIAEYPFRDIAVQLDGDVIRIETRGAPGESDYPFGTAGVAIELDRDSAAILVQRVTDLL